MSAEERHKLATAPLPQIRTVASTSRGAGVVRLQDKGEDGRIPRFWRLDEIEGETR